MSRSSRRSAVAVLTLVVTLGSRAHAGNDDSIFVGNQASMTGGAVSAVVEDASATWYNPAGLAGVSEAHLDVSGTVYALRTYAVRDFLQSTTGEHDDASVTEFFAIPAQIAYARRLGETVTLGLGYFVPQATDFVLRESLHAGGGDNELDYQIALATTHFQQGFAAGLGFRLSRAVRVGVSLTGFYETERDAVSVVALLGPDTTPNTIAQTSNLSTQTWLGLEAGVGFQFALSRALTLALTARSPRLLLADWRSSSATMILMTPNALFADVQEPSESSAVLHWIRAGRAGASLAYRFAHDSFVSFEADVQPGIYNEAANVNRHTVVNARLGGQYRLSDRVAFGAGVFTDRSPDRNTGEPLNGSPDYYGLSTGLELRNQYPLALGAGARKILLASTFAFRYAYGQGTFNDLRVDPGTGDSTGVPGQLVSHEMSLYVGTRVSF